MLLLESDYMKICTKCNREYDDGLNFCSKCGTSLITKPQEYFCPSCGKSLGETFDRFCPYCGCQFGQEQATTTFNTDATSNNNVNTESIIYQNNSNESFKYQSANKPSCLSKEYLFSFKGRRGRLEGLIAGTIFSTIFLFAIFSSDGTWNTPFGYLLFIVGAMAFWAKLANAVKRAHDFGKSGAWLLVCFMAYCLILSFIKSINPQLWGFVSMIAPYIIYLPKGTDGPNKYGL